MTEQQRDPNARRFDLEVEWVRKDIDRARTEMQYEVVQARKENVGEITRIGVRLNELEIKLDEVLAKVQALIVRMAQIDATLEVPAIVDRGLGEVRMWLIIGGALLAVNLVLGWLTYGGGG